MAKGRILKLFLWLLSLPQIGLSLLLDMVSPKGICSDLDRCLVIADNYGTSVPKVFIDALIIAEDHRNNLHPGIDVIAMVRALYVRVNSGQTQGASTIEQQFVRVVSNRYERTVSRKLREQILALMLARRVNKHVIASAYLSIAFYGSGSIGISGLKEQLGDDLSQVSLNQALWMVAQLKYPRPTHSTEKWHTKNEARLRVLLKRAEVTANNSFKPAPLPGAA